MVESTAKKSGRFADFSDPDDFRETKYILKQPDGSYPSSSG